MAHTLYELKPAFQAWLRPAVGRLAAPGLTANQVTLAAVAVSLAVGTLVATGAAIANRALGLPAAARLVRRCAWR